MDAGELRNWHGRWPNDKCTKIYQHQNQQEFHCRECGRGRTCCTLPVHFCLIFFVVSHFLFIFFLSSFSLLCFAPFVIIWCDRSRGKDTRSSAIFYIRDAAAIPLCLLCQQRSILGEFLIYFTFRCVLFALRSQVFLCCFPTLFFSLFFRP